MLWGKGKVRRLKIHNPDLDLVIWNIQNLSISNMWTWVWPELRVTETL